MLRILLAPALLAIALAAPVEAATYTHALSFATHADGSSTVSVSPASCPGETQENHIRYKTLGTLDVHPVYLDGVAAGVPIGRFEAPVVTAHINVCPVGGVKSFFQHAVGEVAFPQPVPNMPLVVLPLTITMSARFPDFDAYAGIGGYCKVTMGAVEIANGPYLSGCALTVPMPPVGATYILHAFAEASAPPFGHPAPSIVDVELGVTVAGAANTYLGSY